MASLLFSEKAWKKSIQLAHGVYRSHSLSRAFSFSPSTSKAEWFNSIMMMGTHTIQLYVHASKYLAFSWFPRLMILSFFFFSRMGLETLLSTEFCVVSHVLVISFIACANHSNRYQRNVSWERGLVTFRLRRIKMCEIRSNVAQNTSSKKSFPPRLVTSV